MFVFAVLHAAVFAFAFTKFSLLESQASNRVLMGPSYMIARSAALVLHVDVALIMFPVCRTLVSLARQTPLNGIIQVREAL
jgi:hypothetical protein